MLKTSDGVNVEVLIRDECIGRPQIKGFSIDNVGTYRIEDVVHAQRPKDYEGPIIPISASIVEAGLLDRRGETVKDIFRTIMYGREVDAKLPSARQHFTYRQNRPMPSISILGTVDTDSSKTELEVQRTKVFGENLHPLSGRLRKSKSFLDALEVTACLSGKRFPDHRKATKKQRISNAKSVVTTFTSLFNNTLAGFAADNNVPFLHKQYPVVVETDVGPIAMALFSSSPAQHMAFEGRTHARSSSPCSQLEPWINMVALTSFLDEGESAITQEELDEIVYWLNEQKKARVIDRQKITAK